MSISNPAGNDGPRFVGRLGDTVGGVTGTLGNTVNTLSSSIVNAGAGAKITPDMVNQAQQIQDKLPKSWACAPAPTAERNRAPARETTTHPAGRRVRGPLPRAPSQRLWCALPRGTPVLQVRSRPLGRRVVPSPGHLSTNAFGRPSSAERGVDERCQIAHSVTGDPSGRAVEASAGPALVGRRLLRGPAPAGGRLGCGLLCRCRGGFLGGGLLPSDRGLGGGGRAVAVGAVPDHRSRAGRLAR